MIIKQIDIESFGKFSNKRISFKDGFNLIYANNGEGKSTLMAFIKLMFYGNCGMSKSSDILKSPRKKYMPWNSSKMSGAIEFETKKTDFRIHKEFKKSTASDKVIVHNLSTAETLPISNERELGSVFFDMDISEFERSVFIDKSGGFSSDNSGDSLAMRIANLSVSGDETISQKKVLARLTSAKEELVSKRETNGALVEAKAFLESLQQQREEFLRFEDSQKTLAEDITRVEGEIKNLNTLKKAMQAKQTISAYKLLRGKLCESQEKELALEKYCEDLEFLRSIISDCSLLKNEIADATEKATSFLKTSVSQSNLNFLRELNENIKTIENNIKYVNSIIKPLKTKYSQAVENAKNHVRGKIRFWLSLTGASVLFAILLGLLVHIAFLILLSLSLLGGLIAFKLSKSSEEKIMNDVCVASAKAELDDAFFEKLSGFSQSGTDLSPEHIEAMLSENLKVEKGRLHTQLELYGFSTFDELSEKNSSSLDEYTSANQTVSSLKSEFILLINKFFKAESYSDAETAYSNVSNLFSEFDAITHDIKTILTSLNIKDISLTMVNSRIDELSSLIQEADAKDYEIMEQSETEKSLRSLQEELNGLYTRMQSPKTDLGDINNRIDEAENKVSILSKRHKSLTLALDTLENAISEANRGLGSFLSKRTGEYLNKISGGKYSEVMVSRDLEIEARKSSDSQYHEWKFLSQGEIDKVYLALRMAVADIIAESHEKLPLFLDDILAQYDDDSCVKALEFLRDYLKNDVSTSQILFFTCHSHIANMAKKVFSDLNEISLS